MAVWSMRTTAPSGPGSTASGTSSTATDRSPCSTTARTAGTYRPAGTRRPVAPYLGRNRVKCDGVPSQLWGVGGRSGGAERGGVVGGADAASCPAAGGRLGQRHRDHAGLALHDPARDPVVAGGAG